MKALPPSTQADEMLSCRRWFFEPRKSISEKFNRAFDFQSFLQKLEINEMSQFCVDNAHHNDR
jgi:hypothetical protein